MHLDEIIVSEIGAVKKPRSAPGRRTAMALAPPAMHPDDVLAEERSGTGSRPGVGTGTGTGARPAPAAPTGVDGVTFIRSVVEPGGMRRWILEDGVETVSGRPQRPPSAREGDVPARPPSHATPVPVAYEPVAYEPVAYEPAAYEPAAYELPTTAPPIGSPRRARYLVVGVGIAVLVAIIVTAAVRRARRTESAGEPVEVVTTLEGGDDAPVDPPTGASPAVPSPVVPPPAVPAAVPDAGAAAPPAAAPDAAPERVPDEGTDRPSGRPRFGTVDIFSDPWADIYLGKKKIGTAPQRGIKLPYGKHRLRLVNPVQSRSTYVTVTIPASRPVRVSLPSERDP